MKKNIKKFEDFIPQQVKNNREIKGGSEIIIADGHVI